MAVGVGRSQRIDRTDERKEAEQEEDVGGDHASGSIGLGSLVDRRVLPAHETFAASAERRGNVDGGWYARRALDNTSEAEDSVDIDIGIAKSGRRAWGFDDIAIVP